MSRTVSEVSRSQPLDRDALLKNEHAESEDVGPAARIQAWVGARYANHHTQKSGIALDASPPEGYLETLRKWREIKGRARWSPLHHRLDGRRIGEPPSPPVPAPGVNWVSIGPSVIRRGQASGSPPVSGRAVDVAIAPGGLRMYLATANGGVWRSDDSGVTWKPCMDNVDANPAFVDADSQACGAVAIDPANPDRVYVGTGEGDSSFFFFSAFGPLGVIYAYAGVGPLRSDSGGTGAWITEPVDPASPTLVGQAFFALAVDPTDPERVVGATTAGIYRREPDGAGGYQWRQTRTGNCTSVVVARSSGTTAYFAALRGGTMLTSADGSTWTALGTGFPTTVARVTLAVRPTNTATIYAFSSAGVHRLDVANGTWRIVTSAVTVDGGEYGAGLAVDPSDITRIYIGAYGGAGGGANIRRAIVSSTGSGASLTYSGALTLLGGNVHPDVHKVYVRSDASDELWIACDGGAFRTTTASGTATFEARNTGLSTALCTYLDNHPTEAAVVFCGAQDNGTLRYTGEEAWLHSADGDGGAVVVNWNDPYKIIRTYVYGTLHRATDGGVGPGSWTVASPAASGALFYPPLVGAPPDATAAHADRIAMGADRTWFSDTFGTSWSTPDAAALSGFVNALVYANADKVYAGTTTGRVYTYTRSSTAWSAGTLVGTVGGTTTGIAPIVTSIVVDASDSTGNSFYVSLGGNGDWRRVWHYDGSAWAARSGPSGGAVSSLLAVHVNTLALDPSNPSTLFAGADIGIWRTTDAGANWTPYDEGLPEAGVSHLKLHATRRLLRCATYGRGVYERAIDATAAATVELYSRDTDLDVGSWPTVDWLNDPEDGTVPREGVKHWESPNIKVDPPSSAGTYQLSRDIDFYQFVDQLVDGSEGVATVDPLTGTAINRVYVEVHNRGITDADNVQVMLLVANASAGLNSVPLPSGYATNVQSGTAISTTSWQTVGIKTVSGVRAGVPKIVEFSLPSTMLPPPTSLPAQSHYCLLALLHHPSDQFNNTETNADNLAIAERKVAQRNLQIVNFTGTLPAPGAGVTPLDAVSMLVDLFASGERASLVLDLRRMLGSAVVVLPNHLDIDSLAQSVIGGEVLHEGALEAQLQQHAAILKQALANSRASVDWSKLAIRRFADFRGSRAIRFTAGKDKAFAGIRNLALTQPMRALLVLEPPREAQIGDRWETALLMVGRGGRIAGGSTYRCQVTLPPDDEGKVPIEARVDRSRGRTVVVARAPKGAEVLAVSFTALGVLAPTRKLAFDAESGEFALDVTLPTSAPQVRRVTLVARVAGAEARKTIDLGPVNR